MKRRYTAGFALLILLWIAMSFLCYSNTPLFGNATLTVNEAMTAGLILTVSVLGSIRFLKKMYDEFSQR